jgi:multiple sugar transport system permease protein/raffinose/stachyose/melibiose transport system permease protein
MPSGAVKWAFLLIMVTVTLYPVLYALLGSFKTNQELTLGGGIFPEQWRVVNYIDAFTHGDFGKYTLNSVIVAFSVTLLALITSSLAGYVFARREFPGKKFVMGMYLAFMFISLGSVTLYPLYMLFNRFGWTQNLSAMILVMTGGQAANVFLVNGFIQSVPKELDEAAFIDGCSPFQVYRVIILPMIRPILAVVMLFSFRTAWNEYITPLIMSIGNSGLRTLTVAVVQLKYASNAAAEWHIMLAGASIALLPVLIIYSFTHKQFIAGLTAGAVKG